MKTELDKLYSLIEDVKIAMMVTRRPDGHLESRPMANQKNAAGADLWFVTAEGSAKLKDITHDQHVNLSYFRSSNMEWVSVSGAATISRDRQKIRELYEPDWSVWMPKEGNPNDGTVNDSRFVLIGVEVHAAVFLEVDKSKPVILFELAKGWLTGTEPEIGQMHHLTNPNRPHSS